MIVVLFLIVGGVLALVAIATSQGARRWAPAESGRRTGAWRLAPSVSAAIEQAAAVFGIPRWFAWAQADKESSLDPSAHRGGREDSWGLYQVNMNAHRSELASRGLDERNLVDPLVNALYFGELARGIAAEARRRGLTGDAVWYAVRLRLKGIPWEDHGDQLARTTMQIFIPYVRKWQGRLGR